MDQARLFEMLDALDGELADAGRTDSDELELLRQLKRDIQRLLERSDSEPPRAAGSVHHGLRELLEKFEGEHPRLTSMIQQIADGLANLGI